MNTASRYAARSLAPPLALAGGVGLGVGALVGAALEILRAPLRPPPGRLLELLLVALPVTWSVALPLAGLVGLSAGLWRWRRDGLWEALMASGVRGAALLGPVASAAALLTALCLGLTHGLEPAARAELARGLRGSWTLVPGRLVELGPLHLRAGGVRGAELEAVDFAWEGREPVVGAAPRARLDADGLTLFDGSLHHPGPPGVLVRFEALRVRLAPPDRRVELVERSTASLRDLVRRMQAKGRAAGREEAELHKRWAWPVAAGLMLLCCPPLALSGRGAGVLALPLLYQGAVRLMDGASVALGGPAAAWSPVLALALAASGLWLRWRDR